MYKKFIKNNYKLQQYAHTKIPGLSGLLGKRPELYLPGGKWPTYYSKAKGCYNSAQQNFWPKWWGFIKEIFFIIMWIYFHKNFLKFFSY